MSDRLVREQRFALEQRLAHTEGKLRAIALRAWPGAVRTDSSFSSYHPPVATDITPLVSFNIPAGRWIALGCVSISPTVPFSDAQFQLSISAVGATTGLAGVGPGTDLPPSDLWFPAVAAGSPSQTQTIIGDLIAVEAVTVTLFSASTTGTDYVAASARLRMMPV